MHTNLDRKDQGVNRRFLHITTSQLHPFYPHSLSESIESHAWRTPTCWSRIQAFINKILRIVEQYRTTGTWDCSKRYWKLQLNSHHPFAFQKCTRICWCVLSFTHITYQIIFFFFFLLLNFIIVCGKENYCASKEIKKSSAPGGVNKDKKGEINDEIGVGMQCDTGR